ncbi:LysE family translocator [Affinibrenneria salicis]|uniref:LysE family translocator n=1 Tax=Affinibrenneria salicis TaxID=2590031 RepID=A0A5J5FV56_9GAMM|nr:LysE family translocator [Affinibrenneria salicis]KAA8996677.1 LysE family translocator [Affinibrenneria salicis]
MTLTTLLIFIPACFALNLAPGPNNLLSIHNAASYGFGRACLAGIGRLVAFVGMIFLSAVGLAALLAASQTFFFIIKLVGAIYLIYIAIKLWVAKPDVFLSGGPHAGASLVKLARTEFLVAAGNPKAILIFTAFLPQFITISQPAGEQFLVLGAIFLLLEWVAIAVYAFVGINFSQWLKSARNVRRFNKACGSFLGCAGIGLLFSKN